MVPSGSGSSVLVPDHQYLPRPPEPASPPEKRLTKIHTIRLFPGAGSIITIGLANGTGDPRSSALNLPPPPGARINHNYAQQMIRPPNSRITKIHRTGLVNEAGHQITWIRLLRRSRNQIKVAPASKISDLWVLAPPPGVRTQT